MPLSVRPAPVAAVLALVLAIAAAMLSVTDVTVGDDRPRTSATPQPNAVLRLGADRRFSPDAIPTVRSARSADRLGRLTAATAHPACPGGAVDLGTWCLDRDVRGTGDFATASRRCVQAGGFLPSAAQLTGAAARVRLSGRLDDHANRALVDPAGHRDLRELSASTITTTTGSRAAGAPDAPFPPGLQVVTVFDNRDSGGFAGAVPVGAAERFRCAYFERQGRAPALPKVSVSRVRLASPSALRLTAKLPAAGRLNVDATVRVGTRSVRLGRTRTTVRRSRTTTVTVRPTTEARYALRSARTRTVTVRLRFRTTKGVPATTTVRARVSRR